VAPENTLAAFGRALDDGADGIELDVRLARDGVPVVIHDATLRRTGLTDGAIAQKTSRQLAETSVGAWFNRTYPALARLEYAEQRLPTLQQVLQFVVNQKCTVYIETKTDSASSVDELVYSVADLINRYEVQDRVVVVSFDLGAIAKTKVVDESIRTGALFAPTRGAGRVGRTERIVAVANDHGADELLLHRLIARPRLIRRAIDHHLRVVAWTVDDPVWIEHAGRLGIHALITNNPALFRPRTTSWS
jgi:glycerophosphoryl diester phosphodiesterase